MNRQAQFDEMYAHFQRERDLPNLEFVKDLLVTFVANLPRGSKPGPNVFDAALISNWEEATRCRDQLILVYGGTAHLAAPYFPTWRNTVVIPVAAPIVLSILDIADAHLAEFLLQYPNALSFMANNPDPLAPDYDARKARHCDMKGRRFRPASHKIQLYF